MNIKLGLKLHIFSLMLTLFVFVCFFSNTFSTEIYALENVPEFSGSAYVDINGGIPSFSKYEKSLTYAFESYSRLDSLGRCGVVYANVCKKLMPTAPRGEIGMVKPAGWHTVKYNDLIDGNYLYNRCHLIGYQLTGENANERNLITGTRYLNVEGMLPFENLVVQYVEASNNHVLYKVTPWYTGDNLIANGVQIEAWSVEDNGKGICFNVYCYNVQPGIAIDYATGESLVAETEITEDEKVSYVANRNTKRFHYEFCSSVSDMAEHNKFFFKGNREELIKQGYKPCKNCNP